MLWENLLYRLSYKSQRMINFKDLQSDDPIIQGELDMLKELNPIFLRIEELPDDYEYTTNTND